MSLPLGSKKVASSNANFALPDDMVIAVVAPLLSSSPQKLIQLSTVCKKTLASIWKFITVGHFNSTTVAGKQFLRKVAGQPQASNFESLSLQGDAMIKEFNAVVTRSYRTIKDLSLYHWPQASTLASVMGGLRTLTLNVSLANFDSSLFVEGSLLAHIAEHARNLENLVYVTDQKAATEQDERGLRRIADNLTNLKRLSLHTPASGDMWKSIRRMTSLSHLSTRSHPEVPPLWDQNSVNAASYLADLLSFNGHRLEFCFERECLLSIYIKYAPDVYAWARDSLEYLNEVFDLRTLCYCWATGSLHSAVVTAVKCYKFSILKVLSHVLPLSQRDGNGHTAFSLLLSSCDDANAVAKALDAMMDNKQNVFDCSLLRQDGSVSPLMRKDVAPTIVEWLLNEPWKSRLGVNLEEQDDMGNTPLFVVQTVELLGQMIQAGADISHRNKAGLTAFDVAILDRRDDIAVALYSRLVGTRVTCRRDLGNRIFLVIKDPSLLDDILTFSTSGLDDFLSGTVLEAAASNAGLDVISTFLSLAQPPESYKYYRIYNTVVAHLEDRDCHGRTALQIALTRGDAGMVNALLELGSRMDRSMAAQVLLLPVHPKWLVDAAQIEASIFDDFQRPRLHHVLTMRYPRDYILLDGASVAKALGLFVHLQLARGADPRKFTRHGDSLLHALASNPAVCWPQVFFPLGQEILGSDSSALKAHNGRGMAPLDIAVAEANALFLSDSTVASDSYLRNLLDYMVFLAIATSTRDVPPSPAEEVFIRHMNEPSRYTPDHDKALVLWLETGYVSSDLLAYFGVLLDLARCVQTMSPWPNGGLY